MLFFCHFTWCIPFKPLKVIIVTRKSHKITRPALSLTMYLLSILVKRLFGKSWLSCSLQRFRKTPPCAFVCKCRCVYVSARSISVEQGLYNACHFPITSLNVLSSKCVTLPAVTPHTHAHISLVLLRVTLLDVIVIRCFDTAVDLMHMYVAQLTAQSR